MIPIDTQASRSKVKPIHCILGKGGISVLQTSLILFVIRLTKLDILWYGAGVCRPMGLSAPY